jgi:hypothetical protein
MTVCLERTQFSLNEALQYLRSFFTQIPVFPEEEETIHGRIHTRKRASPETKQLSIVLM